MAVKLKANIGYMPIVEEVSRKFVPKKETCKAGGSAGPVEFESTGWMGGAVRASYRGGLGACTRNFLIVRVNGRSTAASAEELAARELFSNVATAVRALLRDLSQITNIQAMWLEAKDDQSKTLNGVAAYGYTYRGWVFAVQYAGKKDNAQYDLSHFPTTFDA